MLRIFIIALVLMFLLNSNVAADTTSTVTPKLRNTALASSLLCTIVPIVVGGALLLRGEGSAPSTRAGIQSEHSATLTGLAIGSVGVVLGPGVGHVYARKMGKFWGGVAIRGAAASLTWMIALSASDNSDFGAGIVTAAVALVVGGSICLVSMTHDISTVGTSVDAYNMEHGFSTVTLSPTYMAAHKAPGLLLKLTF
jgi:hypothetical protein